MRAKEISWGVIYLLLGVIYICAEYLSPLWIQACIDNEQYGLLNRWMGVKSVGSLEFYLGSLEERIFGPISIASSGLLFLGLTYQFLCKASLFRFMLAVFAYLLVTKWQILFFPPYGDSASGPFAEAIWLYRHDFNYSELAKQPSFIQGGPKVYLISIYPTVMAFLMKVLPNAQWFMVINHLLVFLQGAVIIALFRQINLRVFNERISLLLSMVLLALPLFQAQVEQINMEIPTLFMSMLAVYYLAKKQFGLTFIFAVLAALTKVYAIIVFGAVFCMGVLIAILEASGGARLKYLGWSLLSILAVGGITYADYIIFNVGGDLPRVGLFEGWQRLKLLNFVYYFLASVGGFLTILIIDRFRSSNTSFKEIFARHYIALIMFMVAGAWMIIFLNSGSFVARYALLVIPFIVFSLFYVVQYVIRWPQILSLGLCLLAFLFFLGSFGKFNKAKGSRIHAVLERNLEYRNDLLMHQKIARLLEKKYQGYTIGAPFTLAQKLALPELGYVSQQNKVVIYEFPCTYGGIKSFRGLHEINISKTIWIDYKAGMVSRLGDKIAYPIDPQDRIIEEISWGGRRAKLFQGGIALEKTRLMMIELMKRQYLLKQQGMI